MPLTYARVDINVYAMHTRIRQLLVWMLIAFLAMAPLRVAQSSVAETDGVMADAQSAMLDAASHASHCEMGEGFQADNGCIEPACDQCAICALALPPRFQIHLPLIADFGVAGSVREPILQRSFPPYRPPRA